MSGVSGHLTLQRSVVKYQSKNTHEYPCRTYRLLILSQIALARYSDLAWLSPASDILPSCTALQMCVTASSRGITMQQ